MYIILVAAVLATVCSLLTRVYCSRWSNNLDVTVKFTSDGVFEGERGEVVETLTNNKLLPVFWGNIQFRVPGLIHFDGSTPDNEYYRQDPITALSYEEITKKLSFLAAHRGYYKLYDSRLVAGDLLFDYKMIRSYPASSEIYIYPRVKDADRFNIDFEKITGEAVARRNLIEDPFFFRGIRDYYPFDSIKAVNWSATARTGSLKVNQYNSTQSQEVMLLLDLDGFNRFDGRQIKEDAISIAALLAQKLTQNGIATGLVSNAADCVTGGGIETVCKNGRNHYHYLLRQMAKLDADRLLTPFDSVIDRLPKKSNSNRQYILISYHISDELSRRVSYLEASGMSVQWIFIKDKSRKIDFTRRPGMYVCEVNY